MTIAASKDLTVREQCDVLGFIRKLREEQAKSGLKPL
jgi:hypothetical protein